MQAFTNPQIGSASSGTVSAGIIWGTLPTGATPSIAGKNGFITANGGATTITDFLNPDPGLGQVFIYFGDNNTTIAHTAGVIELQGGAAGGEAAYFTGNTGDLITFVYKSGVFVEQSRILA